MGDLDEKFKEYVAKIEEGKATFGQDEQNIITAWVNKLSEPKNTDEEKTTRNGYAETLVSLTTEAKALTYPFDEMPYEGELLSLSEGSGSSRNPSKYKPFPFQLKKVPCNNLAPGAPKKSDGTKRRGRDRPKVPATTRNEFADPEEMARAIAKSKGQNFGEFVGMISRHTPDYGRALRIAMKVETANFKDFVDNVLSQRIKDLTEVLDEEQNTELHKIKRDIDKWQQELTYCKKRIKEMIPDFDLEEYRKDKDYVKKYFTLDAGGIPAPKDNPFQKWKEETSHRLKWYSDTIYKLTKSNECTNQQIADLRVKILDLEAKQTLKQQTHMNCITCEMEEYQKLKEEREYLQKENQCLGELEEE